MYYTCISLKSIEEEVLNADNYKHSCEKGLDLFAFSLAAGKSTACPAERSLRSQFSRQKELKQTYLFSLAANTCCSHLAPPVSVFILSAGN